MNDPKTRYLETATRLFAAHGPDGVSLAALAAECGVTKQALLHFFGSKPQIYRETLDALAARLAADLDIAERTAPGAPLVAYFEALAERAAAAPDDARLVARALLDGDPKARTWPLKPYLDRLAALARRTPRWRDAADEAVFAGLYQLIGAAMFFAISQPVIEGMYGADWRRAATAAHVEGVSAAVRAFTGDGA